MCSTMIIHFTRKLISHLNGSHYQTSETKDRVSQATRILDCCRLQLSISSFHLLEVIILEEIQMDQLE